ncbi:MAG: cell envelope integrity protein TolA [Thalassotalea sp.]
MDKKYSIPLTLSVVLHLGLAIFLLAGDFSHEVKPSPKPASEINPIQAVAVDKKKLEARVNQLNKQKSDDKAAERKRIKDLEDRAAKAKVKRAKEQERLKTLEKQRKQKEIEKRKADAAAESANAKAAQAEKARKEKVAEQQKAERAAADAKAKRLKEEQVAKKAAEIRKQREEDQKRKDREAKERQLQEQLLQEQLAAEMAERQQAKSQQVMTEVNRYNALIGQAINRSVLKDKATMNGKSCSLTISITSSGFVTNVVTGRGDLAVCNAAKTGVFKLGTIPMSQDPDVYAQFKKFTLEYIPDFN